MNFKQRGKFMNKREFTIDQEGVKTLTKTVFGTSKRFYDYRVIGKVIIRKTKKHWLLLAMGLLLSIGGAAFFTDFFVINYQKVIGGVILGLGILLMLLFFLATQHFLYLQDEKGEVVITFYDDNPTADQLESFLAHLKRAQRIRLQHRFLKFDENMSYEDYCKNIQWLRDNDFLSEEEARMRLGEGVKSI